MRASIQDLIGRIAAGAALAAVAGVAGCSLPEVLPLAGGTTAGPSPYGPWYEQHWATNAVLLAATDQPEELVGDVDEDVKAFEEGTVDQQPVVVPSEKGDGIPPQVPIDEEFGTRPEANATLGSGSQDFDDSTPYQFPAEQFAPAPAAPPAAVQPVPAPTRSYEKPAPVDGPIRY